MHIINQYAVHSICFLSLYLSKVDIPAEIVMLRSSHHSLTGPFSMKFVLFVSCPYLSKGGFTIGDTHMNKWFTRQYAVYSVVSVPFFQWWNVQRNRSG
jgi:hypothetical protein